MTTTADTFRQIICGTCYVKEGWRTVLYLKTEAGNIVVNDKHHRYDFSPVKKELVVTCLNCHSGTIVRLDL